jgi:hypothetical protein
MKEITFAAPPTVKPDLTEGLSVEILDRKLTRKGTTTLSKPVSLEAGRYIAQATLPDGQVLSTSFDVSPDSEPVAHLLPDEDATKASFEVRAVEAGASPESVRAGVSAPQEMPAKESLATDTRGVIVAAPKGRYRLLAGNDLNGGLHPVGDGWQPVAANELIFVTGGEKPLTIQFQCGSRTLNMLVPLNPGETGSIAWHWQNGRIQPDVTFPNPDVVTLLGHAVAGRIAEAAKCIGEDTPIAKKQLRPDPEHPVCAVICAYILLRTNQIERLKNWTQHLADGSPWLPDSLLVLAEYLARSGDHEAASRALLKLADRGLPLFSSGLSYAVDRLSVYKSLSSPAAASETPSATPAAEPPAEASYPLTVPITWTREAGRLLTRLRGVASRTDFDRTVMTYKA